MPQRTAGLVADLWRYPVKSFGGERIREIFVGPFSTPIDEGVRVAAGISFELAGDPVHRRTYMLTAAFDIPNKYGY